MSHFFLSAATTAQQLDRAMHLSHTRRTESADAYAVRIVHVKRQAHKAEPDKHTPAEIKVCTHCSKARAPVKTVTEGLRMGLTEEH